MFNIMFSGVRGKPKFDPCTNPTCFACQRQSVSVTKIHVSSATPACLKGSRIGSVHNANCKHDLSSPTINIYQPSTKQQLRTSSDPSYSWHCSPVLDQTDQTIFGTCLESKPTPPSQLNHPMLHDRLSIGSMVIPQWISEKSQHPHGKSPNIDFLKGRSQAMHSTWGLSRGDMLLIRSRLVVDSPQCLKWRKKGKIG
jgi:hypothetical protein